MRVRKILKWGASVFAVLALLSIVSGLVLANYLSNDLPDTSTLRNVKYQLPLSVYSKEGLLISRFGEKKRIPVEIEKVPQLLIAAFLAAEDDRFFTHPGVDYQGLIRATLQLILSGQKKQGGSTITMQVVRNFLLSPEKTYERKLKEIILALKIEREFTKNQILQLYLNKIYLGHRSYGIAAASQVYYGKSLDELSLAEYAMIAGLPKAPSNYNPITNSVRALQRRNYVLSRMLHLGYINQQEFSKASNQPVTAVLNSDHNELSAPFIAEMVRNELFSQYGEDIYTSGLKVYTTVNAKLQIAADHAIIKTLHEYDQRHGYRKQKNNTQKSLQDLAGYQIIGDIQPALVEHVEDKSVTSKLQDESVKIIPWQQIKWARQFKTNNYTGPELKTAHEVIASGDIIYVRQLENNTWSLAQVPQVEGALVSLNPSDGAILALSGGFDFRRSKYNRVTQSKRQPGSGFKPIIYTSALENDFTAASIINDAPVVIDDPSQGSEWRPENYSHKFYGPTRLRTALRKSRNLISIRLVRELGVENVIATAKRFGFQQQQLPKSLTLALGSGQATPLQMARVYAVFANGGFLINPYFIDRIESRNGETIFQAAPLIACPKCKNTHENSSDIAPRIISPAINFLMNSLLRDVVQRGTATRAKTLSRNDIAGKTGTTNDQRDAWFNGYTPAIVTTTWVGFDNSEPLGRGETGGKAALPMWITFMKEALKIMPAETPFLVPEGITKAYIDPESGFLTDPDTGKGVWEYFSEPTLPTQFSVNSDGIDTTLTEKPVEDLF